MDERRRQPESLRLREITASLTAGDLERSVAWYRDVVGFTVQEEMRDETTGALAGVILVAGGCRLFLSQDDFAKGRDRVKGVGFRLWCQTAQSLEALAAAIEARGGRLDSPLQERPWGGRDFAVVDPDGYRLSFTNEM